MSGLGEKIEKNIFLMVYDVFHFLSIPLLFPYIKKLDNPFERREVSIFFWSAFSFQG